jgi:pimeloyl-ACP methyl ester carboxylesterase
MSLYLLEARPFEASTVLFLHGLGLSSSMRVSQLDRLVDYHCLAPDLPESGKSVQIRPFTLENTSRCVAELIRDYVSHGPVHIVGMSLGGAVALRLLRDEPELIDHLVICGAATGLPPVLETLSSWDTSVVQRLHSERLAEMLIQQWHVPQAYRSQVLCDLRMITPEALVHFCHEMTHVEVPREASVPTLVVLGQQDPFFVRHSAYEVSRSIPGACAVMVPGASDLWNLQAPDLFTETVRAWITDAPLPVRLVPF